MAYRSPVPAPSTPSSCRRPASAAITERELEPVGVADHEEAGADVVLARESVERQVHEAGLADDVDPVVGHVGARAVAGTVDGPDRETLRRPECEQ